MDQHCGHIGLVIFAPNMSWKPGKDRHKRESRGDRDRGVIVRQDRGRDRSGYEDRSDYYHYDHPSQGRSWTVDESESDEPPAMGQRFHDFRKVSYEAESDEPPAFGHRFQDFRKGFYGTANRRAVSPSSERLGAHERDAIQDRRERDLQKASCSDQRYHVELRIYDSHQR